MAEDIAPEIIAQSKGGGKLAFKIISHSHIQQPVKQLQLFFSSSKDANQKMIYHIYSTKDDKHFEIKYSNLEGAFDFVAAMVKESSSTNESSSTYLSLQLVVFNKNISECIVWSTLESCFLLNSISSKIKKWVNVLDVIDVVSKPAEEKNINIDKKPQVDEDGFVSVAKSKTVSRSVSMTAMDSIRGSTAFKPSRQSSQSKFAVLHESGPSKKSSKSKPVEEAKPKIIYLSPEECSEKAKNILKEYFVGGDTADAVLSIHELVGAGDDGSIARGTKVVEAAVLLVLEMNKKEDIEKFLRVYLECAKDNKIEGESFVLGLNDPLDFLNDVAIDAPLAIPHLASIVAELVKSKIIPFSFLLNSPEYFRTDQNAATFGAKVMKNIGDEAVKSEDFIEVVSKLMTEDDKTKYSSVNELIEAA